MLSVSDTVTHWWRLLSGEGLQTALTPGQQWPTTRNTVLTQLYQVRDVDSTATWRRARRTHWDLLAAIVKSGCELSPLLTAVPFVDASIFRVDWLHCADLGISADFLGNVFCLFMTKLEGRSLKEKCRALWQKLQTWYKDTKCQEQLQHLVVTMIRLPSKPPKLRCSAAQCRALIPFAAKLCVELLDANVPVEAAAMSAMENLHQCYKALSSRTIFHADLLRECSLRFAAQYVALEAAADDSFSWRIKPKLHLFLELCGEGSKPATFWSYRDEDFGGSVSRFSRRRGGLLSVKGFSTNLLQRFKMAQPVLRMV